MGGRFSQVHYRTQDAAVVPHFLLLTQVWYVSWSPYASRGRSLMASAGKRGLDEIQYLSTRLRKLSFNFCLSSDQFAELLAVRGNAVFRKMVAKWFATFQNTKTSTVVNGLEVLTALAVASADGSLLDKAATVFDIFDFDESGAITLDELCILLKSAVRGLSKVTKGLGPRFVVLCPMPEVSALAKQCFSFCDLEEEQDLPCELFLQWVKQTPKIVNLMRCFVQKEFLTLEEATVILQRCARGMLGRRIAAEKRLDQQLELEQEITHAAAKIQDAVVSRKRRKDTMRQLKIEKFAHHGALYTFGRNARGQLGHPLLDLSRNLDAPALTTYFKNHELRVVAVGVSSVHASAVTSNGHVFTWGSGVPGSFGFLWKVSQHHGDSSSASHDASADALLSGHVRKLPTQVEDLDDVVIVDCVLGNHHSVALSDRGVVYTWGSGSYGQLGHGEFTPAALNAATENDDDGIFKWQFDQHTGREYPFVDLPLQLDRSFLEEMRVLQIACGYYFTLALCEDGSVFAWGEGSDGQLGLGYTDAFHVGFLDEHVHGSSFVFMPTPSRINELAEPIRSISVGGNHVFAVARDHRNVYEWGAWNRRGGDAQESTFSPARNDELSTLFVDRIATGKEHSLATAARIELSLTIEELNRADDETVRTFALCARFGAQPADLERPVSGGVHVASLYTLPTGSTAVASMGSTLLSAAVQDRTETHIRASLARTMGKIALLERGTPTGHWLSLLTVSSPSPSLLEVPCVPSAFGPEINESGVSAKLFYSPQKFSCLRMYVRPDEIVGRIVILEFDHEDVAFDSDELELSEMITMIMISLVEKVKDAQEAGASAVVILFDFLEADPFPLEANEDEQYDFRIPVVMMRKKLHGELLLDEVTATSTKPLAILSFKQDVLGKQVRHLRLEWLCCESPDALSRSRQRRSWGPRPSWSSRTR